MIYMVFVKGPRPPDLTRKINEAHAAAVQSLRKRKESKAAQQ